jgi:hypothetical protein
MGNVKCKCLILPAQSGKTRKVEEMIKANHHVSSFFEDEADINIWLSSNNKILTAQTGTRIHNDLATESEDGADDSCIKGKVFCWMSGTKSSISPSDLVIEIQTGEVEMVLVCTHWERIKHLSKVINTLQRPKLNFKKKINIWIDEADKSVELWSKYQNLIDLPIINSVTLVSATIDKLIKRHKEISVIPIQETYPSCYRGLSSCIKSECDFVGTSTEYIQYVIESNPELSLPGKKAFIPGSHDIASHEEIANFLHERGFVVIIINGLRKQILVPGKRPIDLKKYFVITDDTVPEELNTRLSKLYHENNWKCFPLAITGRYCVERGVTFQCAPNGVHSGFIFDYAIIPPISKGDEAYQAMARVFGNIGEFPEYKPVKIFSNSSTFSRVQKKESCAIHLARIVNEEELDSITRVNIRQAENYGIEKSYDIAGPFEDYETAKRWEVNICYKITECFVHGEYPKLYIRWKTEKLPIVSYKETISRLDAGWCSDHARIVPFLQEETIKYLIVYRKDKLKK